VPGYDITNNFVGKVSNEQLIQLDKAIDHMITLQQNPQESLMQLSEEAPECHIAKTFLAFNSFSCGHDNADVATILQTLDSEASNGSLTERELFSAAALANWYVGNYSKAGKLLESWSLFNPNDIMSTRLAMDSYYRAGELKNVLGCVDRVSQYFDQRHPMYGNFLGLLAEGYAESSKWVLADSTAERALQVTHSRDGNVVRASCRAFIARGLSSEIKEVCSRHLESQEEGGVSYEMMHNYKSLAGNQCASYIGAVNVYKRQIREYVANPSKVTIPALIDATIMLWDVHLNICDQTVVGYWKNGDLVRLWDSVGRTADPTACICKTLALAMHSTEFEFIESSYEDEVPMLKNEEEAGMEVSAASWVRWLRGAPEIPAGQPRDYMDSTIFRGVASDAISYDEDEDDIDSGLLLNQHLAILADYVKEDRPTSMYLNNGKERMVSTPHLLSIEPSFKLNLNAYSAPPNQSECQHITSTVTIPICEALLAFTKGEYMECFHKLDVQVNAFSRLPLMTRRLLELTHLEAAMRSGNEFATEAHMLCSERVAKYPNEAQAWKRLAVVHAREGNDNEAKQAKYTAWQHGIGQGGFRGKV
jgi:tetratricopeptide (TPR) repeat protein